MDEQTISDLQAKLAIATEALQRSEEHATAGLLALELMHDIRNPLEALANLTYLAFTNADYPSQVREHLGRAEEQISILSDIVSSTLGLARSSRPAQATALAEIAEAALRIHQRAIEKKRVRLIREMSNELAVNVHGGQILQVVSNLVVNALDALPPEGTLRLRLRKCKGEVHLVIADTGHGIPKEHLDRIFTPFFSTKEERGLGLGLALSKKIVENHSGRIRVRSSVRAGKSGTLFKISLPVESLVSGAA